jgi:hypothetical protein
MTRIQKPIGAASKALSTYGAERSLLLALITQSHGDIAPDAGFAGGGSIELLAEVSVNKGALHSMF